MMERNPRVPLFLFNMVCNLIFSRKRKKRCRLYFPSKSIYICHYEVLIYHPTYSITVNLSFQKFSFELL